MDHSITFQAVFVAKVLHFAINGIGKYTKVAHAECVEKQPHRVEVFQ